MIIAVTGATGFVGGHVLKAALASGHSVRAHIRAKTPEPPITDPRLTWVRGDVFDPDLGRSLLEGADTLIHMAGLIKAQRRDDFFHINAGLVRHISHIADQCHVERILLLSSMAARQAELSHYAASKRAGEDGLAAFNGVKIIIRAPAIFGPGDEATRPLIEAMGKGFLPVAGGRGWRERRLALAYAPDLARDMIACLEHGYYDGIIVSPANLTHISWPEFAKTAEPIVKRPIRLLPMPLWCLYPLAALTSLSSRFFGKGHFTLGKLREFLYEDWQSETQMASITPIETALRDTLKAYDEASQR